jgi:hypothetical protein
LAFAAVLGAAGAVTYRLGVEHAAQTTGGLERTVAELGQSAARLADENRALRESLDQAEAQVRTLEARYRREVPAGPARELMALVNRKLESGLTSERLAFVIGAARNERTCIGPPQTKRFMPETALYSGPSSTVSFADNLITVTGRGETALDAEGRPEAWYDPAKPVTVRFTLTGGETFEVSGKLPLHRSIVVDDAEHRFTIIEGQRGFVKVVGERCRYP